MSHSDQNVSPADPGALHAHELYEQVKALSQDWDEIEEDIARKIIELADDAIKEFGSTNQDKKVELRKIKTEAEKLLPPATFEELKKRGEGHLLQRYPKSKLLRKNLPLIVIVILLIRLILSGISYFKGQQSKTIGTQSEADQPKQIKPSETASAGQNSSVEGLDEAAIAASSPSFSPISMGEFFNTAKTFSLTDMQREGFISQHTGRRVIWEGSISNVREDRDKMIVGLTDFKSDWVYLALFSFSTDHRSDFLALKPGQKVTITGILREWHVTIANLDSSRIIKIFPLEDQSSNKNGK